MLVLWRMDTIANLLATVLVKLNTIMQYLLWTVHVNIPHETSSTNAYHSLQCLLQSSFMMIHAPYLNCYDALRDMSVTKRKAFVCVPDAVDQCCHPTWKSCLYS